jgi:hypothetical protein
MELYKNYLLDYIQSFLEKRFNHRIMYGINSQKKIFKTLSIRINKF